MDSLIKQHKHQFPALTKPSFVNTLNVNSLLAAKTADEHHELALNWAKSVWNAWQHEHAAIATLAGIRQ